MEKLSGDEECRFFDAYEEIVSVSGASSDCSSSIERADDDSSPFASNGSVSGSFSYDIWNGSPGNAEERRTKFLKWMGVSVNVNVHHIPPENSVNVGSLEGGLDRVKESSGAVLRMSDEVSSIRSSISSWSNDSSSELSVLGLREDFVCRDGSLDNGVVACEEYSKARVVSMQPLKKAQPDHTFLSSPLFQNLVGKLVEEQRDLAGNMRKVKQRWLSRLGWAGRAADRPDDNRDGALFSCQMERVKVKHYRKKMKELSALYKGQDIQAHEGSILAMKFSPDGRYLASAGVDGTVRVWQVVEGDRCNEYGIPDMDPSCMYFEVNNLAELKPLLAEKEKKEKSRGPNKGSDSACVIIPPKVFRVLEEPLHVFRGHSGDVLDIAWSKNNFILSASVDKTIRLWHIGCDHCIEIFPHSNYVTSVQFNPVDDNYFISGSIDGKVRIWDISSCHVVDWADVRDIVTAVCYRPDGQGGIVGTLTSNCRFYSISDNQLQFDGQICLHNKKKSPYKKITGFQFSPNDPSRVIVTSANSQVRILHGLNVVGKLKGFRNVGNLATASFTSDAKHIVSACEDSNVYVWNCIDQEEPSGSQMRKIRSCERFSSDASIAIPWCGFQSVDSGNLEAQPFPSPSCFSLGQEFVMDSPKGSATWPEENLPFSSSGLSSPFAAIRKSQYKFLKASCKNTSSSHAWGLVIVTGGWDGRIRSFHNYGLPVPV